MRESSSRDCRLKCRSARSGITNPKPIVHTIVPAGFPAESDSAPLSPKFQKIKGGLAKELGRQGVLECVNAARRLWKWKKALTHRSEEVAGGCLSLEFEDGKYCKIRQSMGELMARHV